jgi:ribosomal protein S18 acetylase RimI-like enzyme
MDDSTLYQRQLDTLAAIDRMMAVAGPESTNLELPGVSVLIVPATPDRSVMNAVCYSDAAALGAAYDEISNAYDEAGITAWTVWVPAADTDAAALLEERGHALDAAPAVMCAGIGEMTLDPSLPEAIDWAPVALADLAPVAGTAFGFEVEGLRAATCGPAPGAYSYLARVDGEPAGTVMAYDHEGDCGIYWVATLEQARGRGICTALMTLALIEGRQRGCTSTSLQATKAGYPIYARLGYRDFGPIQMWEKRASV